MKKVCYSRFSYSHPQELGFYYLQSRYYDPNICRFINADGLASTGQGFIGCNMFAYCNNNPVNEIDPDGENSLAGFADPNITIFDNARPVGSGGLEATGLVLLFFYKIYMDTQLNRPGRYLLENDSYNPDPYGREGQKNQGRELKTKARKKKSFTPRNNRRDGMPAPPKHHTPGRSHRKIWLIIVDEYDD